MAVETGLGKEDTDFSFFQFSHEIRPEINRKLATKTQRQKKAKKYRVK